jgi:hypothetical protein
MQDSMHLSMVCWEPVYVGFVKPAAKRLLMIPLYIDLRNEIQFMTIVHLYDSVDYCMPLVHGAAHSLTVP